MDYMDLAVRCPRRGHDNLSIPLWVYMCFPVPEHQNQTTQLCISPAPGRSSKLTHIGVEIDTCAFQTGCQFSSAASGMPLKLCFFLHNFSGVKRSCWKTGSWWSCLSLEVVSSIPAGSTIIYWFLCRFICVSLCQSIKIKPHKYVYRQHLCIRDGLSVVQCSPGHVIGIVFIDTISVA